MLTSPHLPLLSQRGLLPLKRAKLVAAMQRQTSLSVRRMGLHVAFSGFFIPLPHRGRGQGVGVAPSGKRLSKNLKQLSRGEAPLTLPLYLDSAA